MSNVQNANQMNQLTGDFGQSVPVSAGTSGVDNFNKNMAVARYNKGSSHDDIMRISSQ